jgi:peptide/nickel transport system permease protein
MFDALAANWLLLAFASIGAGLSAWGRNSPLGAFIFERYLLAFLTLIVVSFIVYALMELVPGNCATRMMAYKNTQGQIITEEAIQAEIAKRGLDDPMLVRWFDWLTGMIFRGDLGFSCVTRAPVAAVLGGKYYISLALCAAGLLFAYTVAVPLGTLSSRLRNSGVDLTLRVFSYLGLAIPNFLTALLIMFVSVQWFGDSLTGLFSDRFQDQAWFQDGGLNWPMLFDFLGHVWLPVFVLGWTATALQLQTVRALVSDEQDKLYVTAARARGISGARLVVRYPVRHSIGPVVNSIGFDFHRIFNDLPIVASILVLVDAGQLLLEAVAFTNDQQMAASILFLFTATIVAVNFLTDVLLASVDPRMRASLM